MELNDIKAFLESNKSQPDVQTYLNELSALSTDKVKDFLDTDEGKRLVQPALDKYHAKSLTSWKENNLKKLVDDEVRKLNPAKSDLEIRLEEIEKKYADEVKAGKRKELMNNAIKTANDKGLPVGILDYFVSDDEESTTTNLTKLEEEFTKAVQASVEGKFKENGRQINNGNGGAPSGSIKSITEMAAAHNLRNQNN